MKTPAFAFALTILTLAPFTSREISLNKAPEAERQKIQVAILLDVSGSMNGLIDQAKTQLWNMVSTMGKAKCEDATAPKVEIALYEYGRPENGANNGYIKQVTPFTTDLDLLSTELFKLKTSGGDEYCGQVILNSIEQLNWDENTKSYKVIFIAGNEEFLQGKIHFTKACEEARKKGVIVNTIYCGDRERGIKEHWNLGGECGIGSFTVIDHNAKTPEIPTPFDTTLIVLNSKLNATYIGYGSQGNSNVARQEQVDKMNFSMSATAGLTRTAAKSRSNVYDNSSWDLVDALNKDSKIIEKIDVHYLADSLKNKSREEIKEIVLEKNRERGAIQSEINSVSRKRLDYISEFRSRSNGSEAQTLETEIEKIIKMQAKAFNMTIQ